MKLVINKKDCDLNYNLKFKKKTNQDDVKEATSVHAGTSHNVLAGWSQYILPYRESIGGAAKGRR